MTTIANTIHERLLMHIAALEHTLFHVGAHSQLFSVEKALKQEQQVRGAIALAHDLLIELGLERDTAIFARGRAAVDSVRELAGEVIA